MTGEFLNFQIIHSDDILDLSSQLIFEVTGEFLDFQIIHSDDILDFVWEETDVKVEKSCHLMDVLWGYLVAWKFGRYPFQTR